jgi:hypothetical protein
VKEFFKYNQTVASITNQFNPVSSPPTLATLAGSVYLLSTKGANAVISQLSSSLSTSPLVFATAKKFGIGGESLRIIGGAGVAAIIVISGINIMAKNSSARAKRELAARGLLMYKNL